MFVQARGPENGLANLMTDSVLLDLLSTCPSRARGFRVFDECGDRETADPITYRGY